MKSQQQQPKGTKANKPQQAPNNKEWALSASTAFVLLSSVSLISALTNGIWDCDESMNYWEPMHFLQFGYGLQTWEYSPQYALRSYLYLGLHGAVAKIGELAAANKIQIFYFVRAVLGLISSASMAYLYHSVLKKYGGKVASFLLVFLCLSTGIFISSTSFLPSTFAMYCLTVALAAWIGESFALAEVAVAAAAILGWPFSALVGVPIALDIVRKKGVVFAIKHGVLSLIYFLLPSYLVDTYYYGRPALAVWSIIDYNVISKNLHGGSELYGVEPWYFYLLNGFLNFNVVLVLALAAVPVLAVSYLVGGSSSFTKKFSDVILSFGHIAGFLIWFAYMSSIPHKEERFIFPVYPQLCLAAALCFAAVADILSNSPSNGSLRKILRATFVVGGLITFLLLSQSRTTSMLLNYGAPLKVYTEFYNAPSASASAERAMQLVCVGKEWYRFATHYFLPSNYRLGFIKSDFGGQLPQYFQSGPNATRVTPPNFNDHNREEPSRYVDVSKCDYVVDLEPSDKLDQTWPSAKWTKMVDMAFLEASTSHRVFRAFYVPMVSHSKNTYSRYVLLKQNRTGGQQSQ